MQSACQSASGVFNQAVGINQGTLLTFEGVLFMYRINLGSRQVLTGEPGYG